MTRDVVSPRRANHSFIMANSFSQRILVELMAKVTRERGGVPTPGEKSREPKQPKSKTYDDRKINHIFDLYSAYGPFRSTT